MEPQRNLYMYLDALYTYSDLLAAMIMMIVGNHEIKCSLSWV